MIRIFFTAFILLLIVWEAAGQQVRVLDKSDLQPVSEAILATKGNRVAVVTNEKGMADLSAFHPTDTIYITHVAFQPVITVASRLTSSGVVYLTENVIKLDEFVITGSRTVEKRADLPYKIEVIQARDIQFQNPQNAVVMLEQTGQVFVQSSQMGGGSPVIRGFEANKVLLVVDGVRMNNAIYRAGHLQNGITVDPFGLATTEVLYGPGSTLYGSDAIGGVINFITRDPSLSSSGRMAVHGNVLGRFSSANLERTGGIHLNLGWKKVGVLLNFSYSNFDDLREGKVSNPAYPDFGKRLFYAERIDGKDSTLQNDKPWIQKQSGYSQYNFMGKILYQPGRHSRYTLNVQYSNSSNIPRYDRLTEMKNDSTMRFAEWYYGPQTRLLASLKASYNLNALIFDEATFIAAYQFVAEDRIQRTFGSSNKRFNLETVDLFSFNGDLVKRLASRDKLNYGVEITYNSVGSDAYSENIKTGDVAYDRATRFPDEKANMMYLSAYLSNKWEINRFLSFSQGLRFTYVTLNAVYSDTMVKIMKLPFDPTIEQRNPALNGYLSLVGTPGRDWKLSLIGSTGFRAPNLDDLTKLNVVSGQNIVVPNPELEPEYAYNLEFSVAKTLAGSVRLEGTAYYTWLTNAQVLQPFTYNGSDSIVVDGEKYRVQAPVNAGSAYVCGLQGGLIAQVTPSFSVKSNLTYTYGYDVSNSEPLDHIPPVFGMTSFRLELQRFKGDFYVMYNGWKRISQYSSSGEDNQQYATPDGMPSWYTLNLKLSYQAAKFLNVELGMENILDENYRKFASGISAPGRNVIVALRASF